MARRKRSRRNTKDTSGIIAGRSLGEAILNCLQAVLKRCQKAGIRLDYPGEGRERPFRHWLATDLIHEVLGWPSDKIVIGERFDILLQDADAFPVVTIETKKPYGKASKKERKDFEDRLSGYGTLRTAYFTNGNEWERLDILAPTGELEIREQFEFKLDGADPEEAEAFFAPLYANRHFAETTRVSRHIISGQNSHILQALAADLDQIVNDLSLFFHNHFYGLRDGKGGKHPRSVALAIFNRWCDKSLIVSPEKVAKELAGLFKKGSPTHRDLTKKFADLGLTGEGSSKAVEEVLNIPKSKRHDEKEIAAVLWPAYEDSVKKLCAQTAHVVLARALLYRVGEDKNVFPRVLSGNQLEEALSAPKPGVIDAPPPAIALLNRVRVSMANFLPIVYEQGEFDWWVVKPEDRGPLKQRERIWLRDQDREFERSGERSLRILNGYFFWKSRCRCVAECLPALSATRRKTKDRRLLHTRRAG